MLGMPLSHSDRDILGPEDGAHPSHKVHASPGLLGHVAALLLLACAVLGPGDSLLM